MEYFSKKVTFALLPALLLGTLLASRCGIRNPLYKTSVDQLYTSTIPETNDDLVVNSASSNPTLSSDLSIESQVGGQLNKDLISDENVFEVPPPMHLMNDRIVFTSVLCDPQGRCNTTGLVKRNVDYRKKIHSACFKHKDEVIEAKSKGIHYVKHKKGNVRVYAANAYFQLKINTEKPVYPDTFYASCGEKDMAVPVLLRSTRTFNDKIVLLVTQYYSHISLDWVKLWMNHYFDLGVDYIAVYAGFRTQGEEESVNYASKLNNLFESDEIHGKVLFFQWDSIAELQTWAHSQASMINHGANYFRGSTIMGADLDELLVPIFKKNIREMVKYYDEKYGTWAVQFHSYLMQGTNRMREYLRYHIQVGDLDLMKIIDKSHPCGGSPNNPWQCRAKYMFHSLDVTHLGIHSMHFEDLNYTEAWLDDQKAIMLHLRGLHHSASFKWHKTINESDHEGNHADIF